MPRSAVDSISILQVEATKMPHKNMCEWMWVSRNLQFRAAIKSANKKVHKDKVLAVVAIIGNVENCLFVCSMYIFNFCQVDFQVHIIGQAVNCGSYYIFRLIQNLTYRLKIVDWGISNTWKFAKNPITVV